MILDWRSPFSYGAVGRGRPRIPVVRQMATSDCGAAALAMVLRFYGHNVSLLEIRKTLGTSRHGTNAEALLRAARDYGLKSRGVRLDIAELDSVPPATILHWEFKHFVVLERLRKTGVDVLDPATGRRFVPFEEVRKCFTGVALVFESESSPRPVRPKGSSVIRFAREALHQKQLFAWLISISFLIQALSAILPLLTGVLVDHVIPQADHSLLYLLAGCYSFFVAGNLVASSIRGYLMIRLRTEIEAHFTLRFIDRLIRLPYSFFQQHTTGDLMVRLGSNTALRDILTSTALSALIDGTMACVYLVLLLLASVPLTLFTTAVAVTRLVVMAIVRIKQRRLLTESLDNQARTQTFQVEVLGAIELLKSMGLEHRASAQWSALFVQGLANSVRRGRLDVSSSAVLSLVGAVTTGGLLFYGSYLVLQGSITLGSMFAFSALAGGFLGPLGSLLTTILQLQMLEVYADRVVDVLDADSEDEPQGIAPSIHCTGRLEFKDVEFAYDVGAQSVVSNLSFLIPAGSCLAVVGRTGSGKSTVARLVTGLFPPRKGLILVDDHDLSGLHKTAVRSRLGVVTQDVQLFGGSIRHNIALGEPTMDLSQIVNAAKLACIHQDITAMPMGYETNLSDRGLSLSGGQRQRLAIARALARQPAILILDEATSHLDVLTEMTVHSNLSKLACTRIVIAHRLSAVRNADLIVVLENGRIAQQGRHDELMGQDGPYAGLFGTQSDDKPFSKPNAAELASET